MSQTYGRALSAAEVQALSTTGILVSRWSAEGNANDSADGNNGSLVNGVAFAPGVVGQAFSFDGVDDRVHVPHAANQDPSGSLTIVSWIFPTVDGYQAIVSKWADDGGAWLNQRAYTLWLTTGRGLLFAISDDANQRNASFTNMYSPTNVVPLNTWSQVAAVYDQSTGTRRIFLNGVQVAERTDLPITITNSIADLTIGALYQGSQWGTQLPFHGRIDEVQFHTRALSATEIQTLYASVTPPSAVNQPPVLADPGAKTVNEGQALTFNVTATDPDAGQTVTITATGLPTGATFANGAFSWRPTFNQSGTYPVTFTATDNGSPVQSVSQTVQITANDVSAIPAPPGLVSLWNAEGFPNDSADGNTGIEHGGVSYVSGMIGKAFSFNGTDGYVEVRASGNLPSGSSPRTMAMWVYTRPSSWVVDKNTIFHSGIPNSDQSFGLDMDNYPNMQFYSWPSGIVFNAGVPQEGWVHIALTYDGSTVRVFTQGVERGNLPVRLNTAVNGLDIGRIPPTFVLGSYFDGLIDGFAVFNRALSASEIQAIYASGGLVPPPTDSSPPVVTPVVTGTLGQNGWYVSAVTVSWTLSDPESGIASSTGASTTNLTQDNAGTTLVCTATNGAGLTTSKSVTIKIDQTPPTISATRSPAANANGWNNEDVTVSFQVGDALSGVASIVSPKVVSTEGA